LPKPLIRSDQLSSKTVSPFATSLRNLLTGCHTDYEKFCSIAKEILEQKAICQQDPDQDADEEAPEDQAEYDSVLISSAGDLVAAMANALGSDFASAFNTFYPLIAKYYVRGTSLHGLIIAYSRCPPPEKEPLPQRSLLSYWMLSRNHFWDERGYNSINRAIIRVALARNQ
jgi:hypothetical protein